MESTYLSYIVFQVLIVLLIKICEIQPPDLLFLFVFISFYISRYYLSQISRTSFKNTWKKHFRYKFFFLTDLLRYPHTLNGQNLLSVTKDFCRCSLILICRKSSLFIWQRQPNLPNSELMCYPTVLLYPFCSALDFHLDGAGKRGNGHRKFR